MKLFWLLAWGLLCWATAGPALAGPLPADTLRARLRRPGLPATERIGYTLALSRTLHTFRERRQHRPALLEALALAYRRPGKAGDTAAVALTLALAKTMRDDAEWRAYPPQLLRVLPLAQRQHDAASTTHILQMLADVASINADYVTAQRYALGALRCAHENHILTELDVTYRILGETAMNQHDYHQALPWMQQAVATARRVHTKGHHLTGALAGLLETQLHLHQLAAARQSFYQALPLTRAGHDSISEAQVLSIWGTGLIDQQPDSAAYFLTQALHLDQQVGSLYGLAYEYLGLMKVRQRQGHWPEVQLLARQALRYARQSQSPDLEQEALTGLAASLRHLAQGAAAYDTLQQAHTLADTLLGQQKQNELARLRTRFELDEKEARIRILEQGRRIAGLRAAHQQARTQALTVAAVALLVVVLGIGLLLGLVLRQRRRLQASEAKLREANKTKDQLIRIVGHDLRSPMASLQQLTPLLHDVIEQPERSQAHALIRTLDAGAQHLGNMVDNLFQWARAQGGQLINNPERLRVAYALSSIQALYAPTAQLKNISLTITAPPELIAWADLGLLTTVLRNLAGNALKFTPKNGTVQLTAQAAPDGQVEFSINDSGPGLAPERLTELLTADRLPSTPGTDGEPGTGLGLPLSASFVRMMGGELRIEPRPEGGTRCWFRLPGRG